jgi:predicted ATPase/DNA-binding SARP family transcriptional activator
MPIGSGAWTTTINDGSTIARDEPFPPCADRCILRPQTTAARGSWVDFRVLGPIEVVGESGPIPLGGANARALLAALLLRHGQTISTDALVDAVWERPPETAIHAVAVYVSRLRRALEVASGSSSAIVTHAAGYAVDVEAGAVDLERFRSLAGLGRAAADSGDWSVAWTTLGAALDIWRGSTALACLTTSPVIEARVGLGDERLSVLEDRLDAGLHLGRNAGLVAELRELAHEHPERERLWISLMLALYRSGRQSEALETFLDARKRLDTSFGVEPGHAMRELQHRILDQDPALEPPSGDVARVSLPSPPSSFVGRERDLDEAVELLSAPDTRLVTVVGPGGIGKTRFAIELARRLAEGFPDGVTWLGLDALDDPARVLVEIEAACCPGSTDAPLEGLARALRGKRMLVVLDCFEHVLTAATDLHRLLERVPTLNALVTSRERLGLSAEHLFWLRPLEPADAADLFVARMRAVSRSRPPSADVLTEVCDRLDRLPLAIELVASQLDVKTHDDLLATLERSLDVDGRRDPPARHRTLRATLDWSYALLGEESRRSLRGLSVFVGGFGVEAADAVAGTTETELDRLAGKSLVVPDDEPGRFRLLDTVRSYALERLEQSGEVEDVGARHVAWCAGLARSIEPKSYMAQTGEDLAVFTLELPNLRLALRRAVERNDGPTAMSIVRSLAPYLYSSVATSEGREIARSTLALAKSDPIDRGHVLYYDACISMDMGLAAETHAALDEAEALFSAEDDGRGLSMVENLRCFHACTVGDYADGAAAGERAIAHARRAGGGGLEDIAADHLSYALLGLGTSGPERDEQALARSLALLQAAADRADASGYPYAMAASHSNVASPLLELDRLDEAAFHVKRALEIQAEHGFTFPYAVIVAAELAGRRGNHETAVRLLVPCLVDLAGQSIALQAYGRRQVDAVYAGARESLGTDGVAMAERAGEAMTVGDAIELALTLEPRA